MNPVLILTAPLLLGFALELLFGRPVWIAHPSAAIVWFIEALEPVLRWAFPQTETGERHAGILLATLVPIVSLLIPAVLLAILSTVHPIAWLIGETVVCFQLMGTRTLRDASLRLYGVMKNREQHGDLSRARLALSCLVSVDTWTLNSREIIRIAVYATGRNIVDKIVAPMVFLTLGGGALGMFFASAEVLDASVGQKSGKLTPYGEASAKLCGFLRIFPAALADSMMRVASSMTGFDYRGLLAGGREARDALVEDIRLQSRMTLVVSFLCVFLLAAVKIIVLFMIL